MCLLDFIEKENNMPTFKENINNLNDILNSINLAAVLLASDPTKNAQQVLDILNSITRPQELQPTKPKITVDALLDAIEQVESGGNPNVVGDNGHAFGSFQIHLPYFIDAANETALLLSLPPDWITKQVENFKTIVTNRDQARQVVQYYWRKYQKTAIRDLELGNNIPETCQILAKTHNGGPHGTANPNTQPYWEKVKAELIKQGFSV